MTKLTDKCLSKSGMYLFMDHHLFLLNSPKMCNTVHFVIVYFKPP